MFLSHTLPRPPRLGALALAAASLFFAAAPASAQQFDRQPYHRGAVVYDAVVVWPRLDNPKSRGSVLPLYWYPPTVVEPQWLPAPVAPPPLVVTIRTPPEPKPLYVDIRGPEGTVRSFAVAGGAGMIHTREIVVRAGEAATIRLAAAGPSR